MHIMFHLGDAILFGCLFLLGKLAVEGHQVWTATLAGISVSTSHIGKFFLYGGRFFQVVGLVGTFIESIATIVLLSSILTDFLVGT
ncbi:MAG: hypothetical protein ACP5E2_12560 [Terracidiphilus sp.]